MYRKPFEVFQVLHKQEADELVAQLQKIVDTERKADQIGRRLTVKRGHIGLPPPNDRDK